MVDRATRCLLAVRVVWERSRVGAQDLVEQAPPAQDYYSDGHEMYRHLVCYPGQHRVARGKTQTYSVEAVNAELRHYLARLARSSRCFSRSLAALRAALTVFMHAWNHRQLQRRRSPAYPAHVREYAYAH